MKCRNCKSLVPYESDTSVHLGAERDWCFAVMDSPDPDLERDCKYYRAMTNADRIRSMTDEELADFMICAAQRGGKPTKSGLIRWLDWLKQEATE